MYSIIPEVCNAIWEVLQPTYLTCPEEEEKWLKIADDFYNIWNFPNCIGAIDGKHCRIKAPPHTGSAFHNYKGYFSLVLMAAVDAHYRFIWVDIGDYGMCDLHASNTFIIYMLLSFICRFIKRFWNLVEYCYEPGFREQHNVSTTARLLPNSNDVIVPFSLVGDEGFPLKRYLMRPFARRNLQSNVQRVFNYRLSRARRVVENAFGILVGRWRILHNPVGLKLSTAEAIVQAVTCLHNYIITTNENQNYYLHDAFIDHEGPNGEVRLGAWRNMQVENGFMNHLGRVGANMGAVAAVRQRESLANYFVSETGSIPWQWDQILYN